MEDGLVQMMKADLGEALVEVLILIVVEDGLVHVVFGGGNHVMIVLILIVVEDGLVPHCILTNKYEL